MSIQDSGSFRLGSLDDTGEVSQVQTEDVELFEIQLKKTKRRFRWSLFLLLVLFGAVFTVGYLDLKKRFSMQSTSGIREIENVSAVLEDRLNELQKRIDDLATSSAQDMTALDQKTVVWQKDLAKLRQTVEKLDVSGTVEKERQSVLKEVRKEIGPLEKRIASMRTDLDGIEPKMDSKIAPLSESVTSTKQKVEALQNRIGPLSGGIVDRDTLDLELLKIRKSYRQSISDEISGLDRQIRLLTEKIERLESRMTTGTVSSTPSKQPGAGQPVPTGNTGIQEQTLP